MSPDLVLIPVWISGETWPVQCLQCFDDVWTSSDKIWGFSHLVYILLFDVGVTLVSGRYECTMYMNNCTEHCLKVVTKTFEQLRNTVVSG